MLEFEKILVGKRVFVTGHTGFTGSWLSLWFSSIGVDVFGYSLPSASDETLHGLLSLRQEVQATEGDILDEGCLRKAMERAEPDIVIHLAAQPLVRRSFREPLRTFAVNAQGTAVVLEVSRSIECVKGIVAVTTDKVYENREWDYAYRECDALGGKDPYSASKSAAEMVIRGYRSLVQAGSGSPLIATARGGNIIGGGDFSEDRLIPDFVRAVRQDSELTLRFPDATRPWQHVLALVQGYGLLAAGLLGQDADRFAKSWNLGPSDPKEYSVRSVLDLMSAAWTRPRLQYLNNPLPEAGALQLDSRLAVNQLGWVQPWSVPEMVRRTAEWYGAHANGDDMLRFTVDQIDAWRKASSDIVA